MNPHVTSVTIGANVGAGGVLCGTSVGGEFVAAAVGTGVGEATVGAGVGEATVGAEVGEATIGVGGEVCTIEITKEYHPKVLVLKMFLILTHTLHLLQDKPRQKNQQLQ